MQKSVDVFYREELLSELQEFIKSIQKDQFIDSSSFLEALNAIKVCDKVKKTILGS